MKTILKTLKPLHEILEMYYESPQIKEDGIMYIYGTICFPRNLSVFGEKIELFVGEKGDLVFREQDRDVKIPRSWFKKDHHDWFNVFFCVKDSDAPLLTSRAYRNDTEFFKEQGTKREDYDFIKLIPVKVEE